MVCVVREGWGREEKGEREREEREERGKGKRGRRGRRGKRGRRECFGAATLTPPQSALLDFQALLFVVLLTICTCAYIRAYRPGWIDANKTGVFGIAFKAARVGERLSPWVSLSCIAMAAYILFLDQ